MPPNGGQSFPRGTAYKWNLLLRLTVARTSHLLIRRTHVFSLHYASLSRTLYIRDGTINRCTPHTSLFSRRLWGSDQGTFAFRNERVPPTSGSLPLSPKHSLLRVAGHLIYKFQGVHRKALFTKAP